MVHQNNEDKIETDENIYTNDLQGIEGSDEWDKIERIKDKEIKKRQKTIGSSGIYVIL